MNDELSTLQANEQVSDIAMHETMKDILKLSELLKNVVPYYNFANPQEKEEIIRIIFSELTISQNTFEYKCKKGFECFENRFHAVCDPIVWLSELASKREYISFSIQSLNQMMVY